MTNTENQVRKENTLQLKVQISWKVKYVHFTCGEKYAGMTGVTKY